MGSILQETKQALGLDAEADGFDPELIQHINSVLSNINQLGVGPDAGFAITDDSATWEQFLGSDDRLNSAKALMHLSVKMLFNPPQVGYVLTSYEKLIEKEEWRLSVKADESGSILTGGVAKITGNLGDEETIRLTNPSGQTLINGTSEYEAVFVAPDDSVMPVTLDVSEAVDGVLTLPIIMQTGRYIVRLLSPRRTILTVEVTAL